MAWDWEDCCCLRPPVAWASCSLSEEAESSASGALMEREKESVRRRGGLWDMGGWVGGMRTALWELEGS